MYKALNLNYVVSRTMLIMINSDNKKAVKHESVRILYLHYLDREKQRKCFAKQILMTQKLNYSQCSLRLSLW